MGSLFKTPKAPAPDPELKAAQEREEARLEAEEAQKKKAIAAKTQAKKYGGYRPLLSEDRPVAETGLQKTLGSN